MCRVQTVEDRPLLASPCFSHSQRESLSTNMRVRMSLILSRIELISAIVSPCVRVRVQCPFPGTKIGHGSALSKHRIAAFELRDFSTC